MKGNVDLPKSGIKLSYLAKCFSVVPEMTTQQVCDKLMKPLTNDHKCSFCEYVSKTDPSAVGLAKVFISHSWSGRFLDLIEALQEQFKDERDVLIWLDVVSLNQHEKIKMKVDWLTGTLRNWIKEFNRTVMVLAPWSDPVPLTRGWCIWEIYCSIDTGADFRVAMSQECESQFIRDLKQGPDLVINQMLGTINSEKSKCFDDDDKDAIHEAVRVSVGFTAINDLIFERMRSWIVEKAENYVRSVQQRKTFVDFAAIDVSDDDEVLESQKILGLLYENQGKYERAESIFKECLDKWSNKYGPHSEHVLSIMHDLARCHEKQGQYAASEKLFSECLESGKKVYGPNHVYVGLVSLLNSFGVLCLANGNYSKAESLFLECRGKEEALEEGKNSIITMQCTHNLALLYCKQGRFDLAEPLALESFENKKRFLKEDHPLTLESMSVLTEVYADLRKFDLAESFALECFGKSKSRLGMSHLTTLKAMNNLGALYKNAGKFNDSLPILEACFEIYSSVVGSDHQSALKCVANLADLYSARKEYEKVEKLNIEKILEKFRLTLGVNHHDTIVTMTILANHYSHVKRYEEAKKLWRECIVRSRSSLGPVHPATASAVNMFANFLYKQGNYKEAGLLFRELLKIKRGLYKENPVEIAQTKSRLADSLYEQGNLKEAEPLYAEVLGVERDLKGGKNKNELASAVVRYANLLFSQGEHSKSKPFYAEAELLYSEMVETKRHLLGENDFDTVYCMNSLAVIYYTQGKLEQAEYLLVTCLDKFFEILGPDDQNTLNTLGNLQRIYQETRNFQALRLLNSRFSPK
jgi:tetratricopeptide (TPR) repeat protein